MKVNDPPVVPAYETLALMVIGGYWNTWYPLPVVVKSTNFLLVSSVVNVPSAPRLMSLKVLSSILST